MAQAVIFDLGNVLIPWDPRFLFRKLLPDEAAVERFLAEVCTAPWNYAQDLGREWEEAIAERVARFPGEEALIRAYHDRWGEMLGPAIAENVAVLEVLHADGTPLYALTNWPTDKFGVARARFPFLARFRDIVVSSEVKLAKPDPRIYRLLLERHGLAAADCTFIDDSRANVEAAGALGMRGLHYQPPASLSAALGL